jgi:hypothetical protein
MIGPGIVTYVLDVLPFGFLIIAPFFGGRANLAGNRFFANHRKYYRKYWQTIFFGRHLKFSVPILGLMALVNLYNNEKSKEYLSHNLFAPIIHYDHDLYDEEVSPLAKQALIDYKTNKKFEDMATKFKKIKAQQDYELKSKAFDTIISNYNNNKV